MSGNGIPGPAHSAVGAEGAAAEVSNQGQSTGAAGATGHSGGGLLWNKTQQLPEEAFRQLHSIYGEHFPLEARHHLAGKFLKLQKSFRNIVAGVRFYCFHKSYV